MYLLRRAYFTLEMSLVFPIVLFVMALLIHFTFYLYGRCILSQDTYLLAFRTSVASERDTGGDRESYLLSLADAVFGSKYFANDYPSVEVGISADAVRVISTTEASHRAMSGSSLMPAGSWVHYAGARAEIIDPSARIRRIDRVGDIAMGVAGELRGGGE